MLQNSSTSSLFVHHLKSVSQSRFGHEGGKLQQVLGGITERKRKQREQQRETGASYRNIDTQNTPETWITSQTVKDAALLLFESVFDHCLHSILLIANM